MRTLEEIARRIKTLEDLKVNAIQTQNWADRTRLNVRLEELYWVLGVNKR